jgi:2-polyprenyl-3-methyl-5-hydroxy-6-metoxy-1,4-benzoquinol methylase
MINNIFKLFQNPLKGWDPVPYEYSQDYSENQWDSYDPKVLEFIEKKVGSLQGKKILDLGGGPGQFSVAMSKLGGDVTWLDISNNYLNIVKKKAEIHNVEINCQIGYMDDALKMYGENSFDFIFNRICWYYCINDEKFCEMIVNVLRTGGVAYLDIYTLDKKGLSLFRRILNKIYYYTNIKVGHLLPQHGKILNLFAEHPEITISKVSISDRNERFLVFKNY